MPLSSWVNCPSLTTFAMKSPRTRVITSRSSWKLAGITTTTRNPTRKLTNSARVRKGRSSERGGIPAADITINSESPFNLLSA
ncbi:hypothetical protein SR39_03055 [Methylobacterium radiotolerans]|nr:hypothetical protein SR39_03055 [Methylobacterium radiotolerans]